MALEPLRRKNLGNGEEKESYLISADDQPCSGDAANADLDLHAKNMRILVRNVMWRDKLYSTEKMCLMDRDLYTYDDFTSIKYRIYPEMLNTDDGYYMAMPFMTLARKRFNGHGPHSLNYVLSNDGRDYTTFLMETYPMLISLTDCMDNLFVAGGAVSNAILKNAPEEYGSDVDIFIYGLDIEAATKKVDAIITRFNQYTNDLSITRNKFTLSIRHREMWYQIIFRLYRTKSEILHGFDIGASAVGWDGKELYFTSLSMFAYLTGYIIHDPARASPTYEQRMKKYSDRRFIIIHPHTSMGKGIKKFIVKKYVCPHNICRYVPSEIKISIGANQFVRFTATHHFYKRCAHQRKYNNTEYSSISLNERYYIDRQYTKMDMVNALIETTHYWSGKSDWPIPLTEHMQEHMIVNIPSVDLFVDKAGKINESIVAYFPREDALALMETAWVDEGKRNTIINKIAKRRFVRLKKDIEMFKRDPHAWKIDWIIKNPGAQWKRVSGSVQPRPVSARDYWGKYYVDFPVELSWNCVRLLWIGHYDTKNVFHMINKDIIRHIIAIWSYAETTDVWWDNLCGINTLRGLTRKIEFPGRFHARKKR